MNIFRKTVAIACIASVAGTFSSCNSLNDDDLGITEQTVTLTVSQDGTLTAVAPADITTSDIITPSEWNLYSGAEYRIKFDFKTQKCDLTVSKLSYLNDKTQSSFTLANLPISNEKYPAIVQGVNTPGPVAFQDANGQNHIVTDIRLFCMIDPYRLFDDDKQRNSIYISFKIDGTLVQAIERNQYFFGTTTTTDLANPAQAPSTSTSARYHLKLKPIENTIKADLTILYPKFIPNMPVERMTFPDIPLNLTPNGYILFANKIIPTISGTPYNGFPITDLTATTVYENSFNLDFTCICRYGSFKVKAETTPYALREN